MPPPAYLRDPEIHSGAAVFAGTRVAVRVLFNWLAAGKTLDEFLARRAAGPSILHKLWYNVARQSSIMTTEHAGQINYQDRIVQDPRTMVGKPVVKGTRIPVERVIAHLADNPDMDDLFAAFPRLTIDDVKACLAYAHDKMEEERKHRHDPEHGESRAAHV